MSISWARLTLKAQGRILPCPFWALGGCRHSLAFLGLTESLPLSSHGLLLYVDLWIWLSLSFLLWSYQSFNLGHTLIKCDLTIANYICFQIRLHSEVLVGHEFEGIVLNPIPLSSSSASASSTTKWRSLMRQSLRGYSTLKILGYFYDLWPESQN